MNAVEIIEKELHQLEEKRKKLWSKGKMVQAMAMDEKINSLNAKIEYMTTKERTTLDKLLQEHEEERDRLEVNTAMLLALVDSTDWIITETNTILNRLSSESMLSITDELKQIRKRIAKSVRKFDTLCNDATSEDFAKLSDELRPIIRKKVEEHISWVKLNQDNKILYTQDNNGKQEK